MRRIARIDANQPEIVEALRSVGASVQSLAQLGGGVPDLLVGINGKNYLLEVKDGSKCDSATKLTPMEDLFHSVWKGHKAVVRNTNEALEEIGSKVQ